MKDSSKTRDDGSPNRPWSDEELLEERVHPAGKPIEGLGAPRAEGENTLSLAAVKGTTVVLTGTPKTTIRPHVATLLGMGYSVAELLLARQEQALNNGEDFDSGDVAAYSKIVDAMTKMAREERAQEDTASVNDMSEEELDLFLAEQISKGLLGPGKSET